MTAEVGKGPRRPPRPLVRAFWTLHRAVYRVSRGRLGLWRPKPGKRFGVMVLETRGRRSGARRVSIVGYFEDGPNLISIAMNGWAVAEPAWWLNLRAAPDTTLRTVEGSHTVSARAAIGEERDRLWARAAEFPGWGDDLDALAELRQRQTTVVVFEPRAADIAGHGESEVGRRHTLAETGR